MDSGCSVIGIISFLVERTLNHTHTHTHTTHAQSDQKYIVYICIIHTSYTSYYYTICYILELPKSLKNPKDKTQRQRQSPTPNYTPKTQSIKNLIFSKKNLPNIINNASFDP
jgi:hypothetical protein